MPIYSALDEASGQWLYFRSPQSPTLLNPAPIRRPTPWQTVGVGLPADATPTGSGSYPKGYVVAAGQAPCRERDESDLFEFSMFGGLLLVLQWWWLKGIK